MKRSLTCALMFVLVIACVGVGIAQPPRASERKADAKAKASAPVSAPVVTGKVTSVDSATKTFSIATPGKTMMFTAPDLKVLPKVGEVIDVTYTTTPGGEMKTATYTTSKSNSYRVSPPPAR